MLKSFVKRILLIFILIETLTASFCLALQYSGRYTFGTFASLEEHLSDGQNSTSNDFATSSSRFYFRLSQSKYTFVTDIRDKFDFFDELNVDTQELSSKNTFQVRSLYTIMDSENRGFYYQLGRFSVPSMGATYVDGVNIGYRLSKQYKYGFSGGLNPKLQDQSYLQFNSEANVIGMYLHFTKKYNKMIQHRTMDFALVQQSYGGEVDRQFIYFNNNYQWADMSYIWSFMYLDFVPNTKIQNGNLTYSQRLTKYTRMVSTLSRVDSIEYRRTQEAREELEPSPYTELKLKYYWYMPKRKNILFEVSKGKRSYDDLDKTAIKLAYRVPYMFSKFSDLTSSVIVKDQFNKKSTLLNLNLGYFRKKHEIDASFEFGKEVQAVSGETLTPKLVDITWGYNISRQFLLTATAQYAGDEKVDIRSGFFKMIYRFGSKSVAPLRDGAAPRGRL